MAIEFEDNIGNAREPLTPSKQERTAHWTHLLSQFSRLLLLFSHGVLVYIVSCFLDQLDEISWWLAFLPVWIGDGFCIMLLVLSWFASCPYIKLCVQERSQRVGANNPSLLTDILPDIVRSILGSIFVLLMLLAEIAFCAYLGSVQRGRPYSLALSVIVISIVAFLAVCRGVLLTDESPVFIAVGIGMFASVVIFAVTRGMEAAHQAVTLVPVVLSVAGLLGTAIWNLLKTRKVLSCEERVLRFLEILALMVMLIAALASTWKVKDDTMVEARAHGLAAGIAMCVVALLRGRMYVVDLKGPVSERMLALRREACASSEMREVKISRSSLASFSSGGLQEW